MTDISDFLTLGAALVCAHKCLDSLYAIGDLLIGRSPAPADIERSVALLHVVARLLVAARAHRTALERSESPVLRPLAPHIAQLAAANDLSIAIAHDLLDLLGTTYGANVDDLNTLLP